MGDSEVLAVGSVHHLPVRPKIVCLCGSTRFMDTFFEAGWNETLAGHIVLSVGVVTTSADHAGEALGVETVQMLDELHWRKIDLADEVLVLNVGGYIGFSTRRELEYALSLGKSVRYWETVDVAIEDSPSTVTSADWFNRDDNI